MSFYGNTGIIDLSGIDTTHVVQVLASLYQADGYVSSIYIMGTDRAEDLVKCRLGNYSYDVRFDFVYPIQSITVESSEFVNDIIDFNYASSPALFNLMIPYQMVLAAFEDILLGSAIVDHYQTSFIDSSLYYLTAINWTTQGTVIKGMEETFKNITLSMLSSEHLM